MKNMSVKKIVAMIVGAAAVLAVAAVAAVLALRVDSAEAQQIALDTVGGGEIVSQEASRSSRSRRQAVSSTFLVPTSSKAITTTAPERLTTMPGPKARCTTAVPGR